MAPGWSKVALFLGSKRGRQGFGRGDHRLGRDGDDGDPLLLLLLLHLLALARLLLLSPPLPPPPPLRHQVKALPRGRSLAQWWRALLALKSYEEMTNLPTPS